MGASEWPLDGELELAPWERRGGSGRKLQADEGRWETRVYIWASRDCCVWVS